MKSLPSAGVPIKAWVDGVPVEDDAVAQLQRIAVLPVVGPHVAVMPDVHLGKGATIGSVVPTRGAIIPAAVGVDIGCGMMAIKTNLTASMLPDSLAAMRSAIEVAIPHGRTNNGGPGDRGAWGDTPRDVRDAWTLNRPTIADSVRAQRFRSLAQRYELLCEKHPRMRAHNTVAHLGTLGTGNHFVEVCVDETQAVWIMLHSGSRGVGNRIGSYFISLAKDDMRAGHGNLPEDQDLAYLTEGTEHFDDYVAAVSWAQEFARLNREIMMRAAIGAVNQALDVRSYGYGELRVVEEAINCHHNYVARERHFGEDVWLTRKGAVNASSGKLGIIPGSMGAKSFIVRGKGNAESFHSCSHGAGRKMSRGAAKRMFTLEDHAAATAGIECRKDVDVIDETPGAYKAIDDVMHAQRDLVEVVSVLRQVLCVKG